MYFVGVDIAKTNHFASVQTADGTVACKPFPFTNDSFGFAKFLAKLQPFAKKDLLIGLENTSHYGENLTVFLFERGYQIALINPYQTNQLRKTNIRQTKTDKIDCGLICQALSWGKYRLFSAQDSDTLTLKHLCRFRQKLMKSKAKAKIQLRSYVDLIFPEFQNFFCSMHLKTSYSLLKTYPSPKLLAKAHLTSLTKLMENSSRKKFSKENAVALRDLAKRSVGIPDDILALQITETIAQIELLESQLKTANASIKAVMDKLQTPILTIPGISITSAAQILGEIGDIKRFSNPNKLVAYAGLDPKVKQSGNSQLQHARMSKKGSKLLRYALMNSAWITSRHNATFKAFYEAKKAKGLTHYAVVGHCAGKLARIVFKLLTDNIEFDETLAI